MVEVGASGVCHSDISVWNETLAHPVPLVLGHEAAGTVTGVGAGVTSVAPGDRVVLSWLAQCGTCFYCVHPPATAVRGRRGRLRPGHAAGRDHPVPESWPAGVPDGGARHVRRALRGARGRGGEDPGHDPAGLGRADRLRGADRVRGGGQHRGDPGRRHRGRAGLRRRRAERRPGRADRRRWGDHRDRPARGAAGHGGPARRHPYPPALGHGREAGPGADRRPRRGSRARGRRPPADRARRDPDDPPRRAGGAGRRGW